MHQPHFPILIHNAYRTVQFDAMRLLLSEHAQARNVPASAGKREAPLLYFRSNRRYITKTINTLERGNKVKAVPLLSPPSLFEKATMCLLRGVHAGETSPLSGFKCNVQAYYGKCTVTPAQTVYHNGSVEIRRCAARQEHPTP